MRERLQAYFALISIVALLTTHVGCATYTAVKIPGAVHDEDIALGMHRSEVEALLAAPPVSEYDEADGGATVRYDYADGVHQASKARVILYIAGDVFTLFLSELIFWPIEVYARNQTKRVGTAYYDGDNVLRFWSVGRPSGQAISSLGAHPTASAATAESTAIGEAARSNEATTSGDHGVEPSDALAAGSDVGVGDDGSPEPDAEHSLPEVSASTPETAN